MAKLREILPVSEWLTFELATLRIDPPVVRLKLKPLTKWEYTDIVSPTMPKPSWLILERALQAIVEWDLEIGDKPLPCTEESKGRDDVRAVLATPLKQEEEEPAIPKFLALAIIEYAEKEANFLKN